MQPDTIIAPATPAGRGGIGIIRLSGPDAVPVANRLTRRKSFKPRYAHSCNFYTQHGVLIDSGLVLFFRTPYSFTGEDVIELHAHGSPVVLNQLVRECIGLGARLAKPGEFSERAFLNEKIDLMQAEAIAGLIEANTETAAQLAIRTLQGEFSSQIQQLNAALLNLRLYVEAAIDFPEEEIDFLTEGSVVNALDTLRVKLQQIIHYAKQGLLLQEGGTLVIAGLPNAGKSTLMNALARHDVAIVTEIAGTTRDVLREQVLLDEIPLCLVDTAGLRETTDVIEQMGIQRAWEAISRADCLLFVSDSTQAEDCFELDALIKARLPEKVPVIRVMNKIDASGAEVRCVDNTVYLSARQGQGMPELRQLIKQALGYRAGEEGRESPLSYAFQ